MARGATTTKKGYPSGKQLYGWHRCRVLMHETKVPLGAASPSSSLDRKWLSDQKIHQSKQQSTCQWRQRLGGTPYISQITATVLEVLGQQPDKIRAGEGSVEWEAGHLNCRTESFQIRAGEGLQNERLASEPTEQRTVQVEAKQNESTRNRCLSSLGWKRRC